MSQVIRKYNSGGQTDKPKLLSIKGLGDFNQDDLIKRGYRDVDEYTSSKGLKNAAAADFRNAVQYMLEGMNNGTITMDAMGNFQDATGQKSSTGELDRKKFLGIKTGVKNTENNAYGLAADYLYNIIKGAPQYKQPEVKAEKFNTNDYLTKEISKRWYGGNNIDFGNWFKNRSEKDRNALIADIFNSADYNKLYQEHDWTDTGINSVEDLIARGRAFGSAISNNKLDNDDYNTFATLGGSGLDKFLREASVETEPTPEQSKMKVWEDEARAAGASTPEAISAYVQGKQREEADRNEAIIKANQQEIYERERNKFFNDYATRNPFKESIQSGYVPSSVSYKPEDYDKPIKDFYNNNIDQYLNDNLSRDWFRAGNTQHIANHMDYLINHLKMNLPDAGDGFVAIPSTFDYNNYTTMVYNPTTRQYRESSMLVNDALRRLANAHYDSTRTSKKENGGILYMQFGGTYSAGANYSSYQQQRAQEKKTKEEETVRQKAESKGRTTEEQRVADRKPGSITSGDWTGADYTRLASIVADIGSLGAAYVPVYGTAASAVLGVGSSLANYGADVSENGFKWGDLGSLAMNLGLDTVGLIPGLGTAAKGSKMLKTAVKYIPKTLSLLAAYNYTGPAIESMKKAMTPGADLTVDDWRNIAEGFKMVLQGGKGVKRTVQARNLKKDLATGNKVLTTLGGKEVSVTPAQLSEIRSHRKLEDQEAALQLLLKDDNLRLAGDLNKRWFNPSRYLPDSNIRNEYDFNKKVKKRTSQGWIEVPRVYSNSDKYIAATMQQNVARIPGVDELSVKYNDWKYGVEKSPKNNKGKKSSSQKEAPKEMLALPAPGQTHRVFQMGSGQPKVPQDVTNPSNLSKPGTYQDRAVHVGGTPVESPNANAVRTVRTINSILEPFVPKTANLPAVIPASRNANKVVASQTIQPSQRLDQFIEGQIPGGKQFGRQRAKTEREYRDVFHPAAEREQNRLWNDLYEYIPGTRTPQSIVNEREVARTMSGLIKSRQSAKEAKTNVDKQIALITANIKPNRLSPSEYNKRQRELNATFNQKKYDMEEALRKRDLPHKKSNKKKKTSKDDRVTKKAEGGLIQFLQGGDTVGRIKAKDMSNWNRASALANYDWVADIDRWKASHTGPDDWQSSYMLSFNGGEDIYDQLTNKTGDYFGGKYNYSVQDPLAKQRQITFRGTNQGFDDLIRNGIVGYGTTEGATGFDVYAGDRTGNRTLARGMTPEDVARFNKQLATRGMELYDKGNGTYRLRALQEPTQHLDEVVVTAPKVEASDTTNPSGIKRVTSTPKKKLKLNVAPEEVLALGRMVGGLAANNRAAKVYKEGLKPTLLDTFENAVPLQGNFQAKTNAEQQAGNLESVAARPRTSDASLQLAGELEASDRAGQARFQGGLQDAEMFYKTRMLGQQESDAAKARRVEVANRNRASMNAIDAAKKQIDAGRITANYQQVIAPYLAGVENRFRQARGMKNQLALESYLNRVGSEYDTELAEIGETYKNDPVGAQREISKLRSKYQSDALKERTSLIDTPWLVRFSGKGSKLSYAEKAMLQRAKDFNKRLSDDNKQFHKDIMESKREHNKMIANMSALTAALIKKGMQL